MPIPNWPVAIEDGRMLCHTMPALALPAAKTRLEREVAGPRPLRPRFRPLDNALQSFAERQAH
jgi:hypothetical protein